MTKYHFAGAVMALAALSALPANATVLATYTAGSTTVGAPEYYGESVTTLAGGPFDNITFNFYDHNGISEAMGTLYVFSSIYTGTPLGLAAAGALAVSISNNSNSFYSFAPSITLNGGQQYFFYEARSMTAEYAASNGYSGGDAFFSTGSGSSNFVDTPGDDVDFRLTGVSIPEPMTLSLFGAGLAGAAAMRRRRKANKA